MSTVYVYCISNSDLIRASLARALHRRCIDSSGALQQVSACEWPATSGRYGPTHSLPDDGPHVAVLLPVDSRFGQSVRRCRVMGSLLDLNGRLGGSLRALLLTPDSRPGLQIALGRMAPPGGPRWLREFAAGVCALPHCQWPATLESISTGIAESLGSQTIPRTLAARHGFLEAYLHQLENIHLLSKGFMVVYWLRGHSDFASSATEWLKALVNYGCSNTHRFSLSYSGWQGSEDETNQLSTISNAMACQTDVLLACLGVSRDDVLSGNCDVKIAKSDDIRQHAEDAAKRIASYAGDLQTLLTGR